MTHQSSTYTVVFASEQMECTATVRETYGEKPYAVVSFGAVANVHVHTPKQLRALAVDCMQAAGALERRFEFIEQAKQYERDLFGDTSEEATT